MTPFCFYRLQLVSQLREDAQDAEARAHLKAMERCAALSDCLCREVCLAHVRHMQAHAGARLAPVQGQA